MTNIVSDYWLHVLATGIDHIDLTPSDADDLTFDDSRDSTDTLSVRTVPFDRAA